MSIPGDIISKLLELRQEREKRELQYLNTKKEVDPLTKDEHKDLDKQEKKQQIKGIRELTIFIKWFITLWLGGLFLILLLQGFGWKAVFGVNIFYLDPNIVMVLIGGTTVKVIGCLVIVLRYYFKASDIEKEHQQ